MTAHISAYGRLGRDPELRTSAGGKAWATASLAVQSGGDDAAIWLGVIAFGTVAETLCKHGKGEPISVSGRVKLNRWTDREGNAREQLQIVADHIVSARTVRPGSGKRKSPREIAAPAQVDSGSDLNDEIPF